MSVYLNGNDVEMSFYYPSFAIITGITNAVQAVVTFAAAHDFTNGEIISLRVSKPYGMVEINNLASRVFSFTTYTVTILIDTTNFTPFVYPGVGTIQELAMAVPAGSGIVTVANGSLLPTPNPYTNFQDAFDHKPG